MNPEAVAHNLVRQMRKFLSASGRVGGVLGLSGGVDSTVVAKLAAIALGEKNVCALVLPAATTDKKDVKDAVRFAESLGIEYYVSDISGAVSAARKASPKKAGARPKICDGNLTARIRMALLYDTAAKKNYVVLGTSNRSELLLGYFTKYGDGGSDVLPIGALYKTEVYELAKYLKIPAAIVKKAPSAGLWPGQTDEGDIGMPYKKIDGILRKLMAATESGKPARETKELKKISRMVESSRHKRNLPPILEPYTNL
ncbi:MAG: NAD+ synthase [Candidatus Micrarchaeota archaeon]|nr:NAD+ synthase [Candidatus Micrarchaeota archaeon]